MYQYIFRDFLNIHSFSLFKSSNELNWSYIINATQPYAIFTIKLPMTNTLSSLPVLSIFVNYIVMQFKMYAIINNINTF